MPTLEFWTRFTHYRYPQMFGRTPDPDFAEASILEQYQAQIASAIAPAFTAESSPELVTQAINVCATFVSAGVVTNVDRMGRIFRPLLVGLKDLSSMCYIYIHPLCSKRKLLIIFQKTRIPLRSETSEASTRTHE